jgi:hypothetical protein
MRSRTKAMLPLAAGLAMAGAPMLAAGTASAAPAQGSGNSETFMATVSPLNGSNVHGTLQVWLDKSTGQAKISEHLSVVAPTGSAAPHAQHLHFSTKANGPFAKLLGSGGPVAHTCPGRTWRTRRARQTPTRTSSPRSMQGRPMAPRRCR